jgi:CRP-like cAMP-binding protein
LGPEDFEEAGIRIAARHFGAKDIIFAPGDPDDRLYFSFEGTVPPVQDLRLLQGGHHLPC